MDQNKLSHIKLLSDFATKATSELIAVVIIVLSNMFFIYQTLPHIKYFGDDHWYFYLIFALTQIIIFVLCLRILWDNSFSKLKNQIEHLRQDEEKPRKPE